MDIRRTPDFEKWLSKLRLSEQMQVESRISRISKERYFGDAKLLGKGLAELRWKNGRRIYFARGGTD